MTQLKTRITTAIATSAVLLSSIAPSAFAAQRFVITGNGSNSDSNVDFSSENTTSVVQNNNADISNNVDVDASTGGNSASDNTGGDVLVRTGDSDVDVIVKNMMNTNSADVTGCNTCAQDTDVLISGNGSHSDNDVDLDLNREVSVFQGNNADVDNDIDVDASTGENDADDNTGGDVRIGTGDVNVDATVWTTGNVNSAILGGGNGNDAGVLSARITGNGSNSDNNIDLDFDNAVSLVQGNNADVENDVDVDAETGDNSADDNTGGDVIISTGDVDATATIDNAVNFNMANVDDCGCVTDLLAKIDGNGTGSDNEIEAELGSELEVFQKNEADLNNDADFDLSTGDNTADDNTGSVNGISDPAIVTGDSDSEVKLHNSGNVNTFGSEFELPEMELDFNMDSVKAFFMSFWGSSNHS